MARFLAIDWDQQQVRVVAANVSGGMVKIERAAAWQEEKPLSPATAEELGQHLRRLLQEAGITGAPALVCVSRDRVIVKEIRFPPVSPTEEAQLVRFQAIKELTEPPDDVVIDYAIMKPSGPQTERRALVLIARREVLNTYQKLCEAAGIKLQAISPRALGIVACLQAVIARSSSEAATLRWAAGDTLAVLVTTLDWAEFCVIQSSSVVFARSVGVGPGLAGEVRRNLAVYAGQSGREPVRALYLAAGDDDAALREQLQTSLGIPVYPFDPFPGTDVSLSSVGGKRIGDEDSGGRGGFTGAIGLLHAQATREGLPIDFVHPKQPVETGRSKREHVLVMVAIACFLFVGMLVTRHSLLAGAEREARQILDEITLLDKTIAQQREDDKTLKAFVDWSSTEVVLPDELYDLGAAFPDVARHRLKEFNVSALAADSGRTPGKDKKRVRQYVTKYTLKGLTTLESRPIENLHRFYQEAGSYRLTAPALDKLRNEGLPHEVADKLRPLLDKSFSTEQGFLDELKKHLQGSELTDHKSKLIFHAREPYYNVHPLHFERARGRVTREQFEREFTLEFEGKKRLADQYSPNARITPVRPAAPKRPQRDSFPDDFDFFDDLGGF